MLPQVVLSDRRFSKNEIEYSRTVTETPGNYKRRSSVIHVVW
jgi:hypothetical protein